MRVDPKLAHGFIVGACDHTECKCIHFGLQDEHGRTFATMTIHVSELDEFIKELRNVAYDIAVLKEEAKDKHGN